MALKTFMEAEVGWGKGGDSEAPKEWPAERPDYTSLYAAVQGEAARWNVPGITVAVLHDGQIDEVAVGFANLDTKQPMTTDTIQQIGSISKIFTTTLAMTLVDEGKLDLDEPITTYVPDFALADTAARDQITLRHIFSHSAGFEGDTFDDYGRGDDAVARAVAEFPKLRQWFQPGQLFSYNNNGFILAALAIQNVTGEIFEDLMYKRIFTPLKLESTVLYAENAITYPHSVGHLVSKREDGPKVAKPYAFPRQIAAPGGIIATSRDQIRFAQMHINKGELDGERIISEELATLMVSAGLLARKGAARPAMRRQPLGSGPAATFGQQGYDDLGWNDMGYDVDPQQSSEPARMVDLKPLLAGSVLDHNAAAEHAVDASTGHELIAEETADLAPADMAPLDPTPVDLTGAPAADIAPEAVEVPEIVRQQESLIERVAAVARKVEARPEPKAKKDKAPRTQRAREKAAFTLRLDAERHLRLRLASAVTNRSAQTILTELLDDYLSALPEIDAMASRLPAARPLRKSA